MQIILKKLTVKLRNIKIYDDGTYRYQPVDENFILPSNESIQKRTHTTRKFDVVGNCFGINISEVDLSFMDKLDDGDS